MLVTIELGMIFYVTLHVGILCELTILHCNRFFLVIRYFTDKNVDI
jgi:hypothetical protein